MGPPLVDSCGSDICKIIRWVVEMLQNTTFVVLEMKSCDVYDTTVGLFVFL